MDKQQLEVALKKAIESGKKRKFVESVELIVVFSDIDLRNPSNRIKTTLTLPHTVDEDMNICVIASGDMVLQAKELNLDVIDKEQLETWVRMSDKKLARKQIKKYAKRYDFFIARADLMPLVGRALGPVLAPRNKMPLPVPLGSNLKTVIERVKKTVRLRMDKNPVLQVKVGTINTEISKIIENIMAVLHYVEDKLSSMKSGKIRKIYIKKTMGPAVEVKI